MSMLDDIKSAEAKAEALKEAAAAEVKEYAAAVEAKSAADRAAAISAAAQEAEKLTERAENEAASEGERLVAEGSAADKQFIASAEKNLGAAVDAVFAELLK